MESLLTFAEELERRDADVGRALDDVETLQADVEAVRREASGAAAFFASLPARRLENAASEQAALAAQADAQAALRAAEDQVERARKEDERLEAMRAKQDALDALSAAERWLEETRAARAAAETEAERWTKVQGSVAGRAAALTPRIPAQRPPDGGLDDTIEWASQARGALLLERSNLARERETIIREANELTASVLGEPLASGAVAGLRDRLAGLSP